MSNLRNHDDLYRNIRRRISEPGRPFSEARPPFTEIYLSTYAFRIRHSETHALEDTAWGFLLSLNISLPLKCQRSPYESQEMSLPVSFFFKVL